VKPRVISAFGWINIAVLHANDEWGSIYARGMRDNSPPAGVNVVTSVSYTHNDATTYGLACASLEASGANIIVAGVWDQDFTGLLTACRSGNWRCRMMCKCRLELGS
jgi:hypothetical protein